MPRMAYSRAPTMRSADFQGLPIWYIPLAFIVDYSSHIILKLGSTDILHRCRLVWSISIDGKGTNRINQTRLALDEP